MKQGIRRNERGFHQPRRDGDTVLWGKVPRRLRDWHTSPAEAVQACLDVGAPRMATMHWGTFVLSAEPVLSPVERAREAWAETGRPREDLWDLAVGESRSLSAVRDSLQAETG